MELLVLVLLIAAAVLFILAAFNVGSSPRIQPVALGLACWIIATILEHVG
jgi:hypothetical protein